MYDSTIHFTLDTICPFTYLAKKRLDKALAQVRSQSPDVAFTAVYQPYQLFNDAPIDGDDKRDWYLKNKYHGSEEMLEKYMKLMSAYGEPEGIHFNFGGKIANTLESHRVVQHFQEAKGSEVGGKLIDSLYKQYFENEAHPSSRDTLMTACIEAGISESEASSVVDDRSEGLQHVKELIREQAGNGVDAVPHIIVEGKRRDITLEGAKEVPEYLKALEQVIKEAS